MSGLDGAVDQKGLPVVYRDVVDPPALNDFSGGRDLWPRKPAVATAFGDVDSRDGFPGMRCPGIAGGVAFGGWKAGKGTLCGTFL